MDISCNKSRKSYTRCKVLYFCGLKTSLKTISMLFKVNLGEFSVMLHCQKYTFLASWPALKEEFLLSFYILSLCKTHTLTRMHHIVIPSSSEHYNIAYCKWSLQLPADFIQKFKLQNAVLKWGIENRALRIHCFFPTHTLTFPCKLWPQKCPEGLHTLVSRCAKAQATQLQMHFKRKFYILLFKCNW